MLNSKMNGLFEEISDADSASVAGGFWGIAIPIAVALGTSIYLSVKHKGAVVGYDSGYANGAQQAVRNSKSGKGLFGWGFLGL